jgi:hypothetical protein
MATYALNATTRLRKAPPIALTPIPVWDQLEELLASAHTENQHHPLPQPLVDKIQSLVLPILAANRTRDILYLTSLLSSHNFFYTKDWFHQALDRLIASFPHLNPYFSGRDHILTPESTKILLSHFEKTYGFEPNILSCEPLENLFSLIENFLSSEPSTAIKGWILYKKDHDHLTPVFVKKEKNSLQILITNSQGLVQNGFVFDECKKLSFPQFHTFLYTCSSARQRDGSSCPVFSLLDLKNLLEAYHDGKDIFSFLSSQPLKELLSQDPSMKVFSFSTLPPYMMKVTQSIKQLTSYYRASPDLFSGHSPVFIRRSPTQEVLQTLQTLDLLKTCVETNSFINPSGDVLNKYIERKYLQCVQIILSAVMPSSPTTP